MVMEAGESLISVECRMGVHVVTLLPKHILDAELITELGQVLGDLVEVGAVKMAIDFSNVLYLSSGALGMLIHTKKLIESKRGKIALCAIKPLIEEIFRITRLGNTFSVLPTVEDAVASLQ
jgi:anti-sigma B factor antagonist